MAPIDLLDEVATNLQSLKKRGKKKALCAKHNKKMWAYSPSLLVICLVCLFMRKQKDLKYVECIHLIQGKLDGAGGGEGGELRSDPTDDRLTCGSLIWASMFVFGRQDKHIDTYFSVRLYQLCTPQIKCIICPVVRPHVDHHKGPLFLDINLPL